MKTYLCLLGMSLLLTACQSKPLLAPENSRPVVGPRGSSDIQKPWNNITKQEGDAALGPIDSMRR